MENCSNIDVLFLNENMNVIKEIENLWPKVIMPVKDAVMVIGAQSGKFADIAV